MKPVHWYHLWVGDRWHGSNWLMPAREHFNLLRESGFEGDVHVGVVGGQPERSEFKHWLAVNCPQARVAAEADEGYEQVTIEVMHTWAKRASQRPEAVPVYYSHAKGSFNSEPGNHMWRRAMDAELLGKWRERVADLDTYQAVGLHWLTHQESPELIDPCKPMFGGNFWWTTAGYLATLKPVEGTPERPPVNRWGAEGWMGQGFPKVLDLKPGWPDYR